MLARERLLQALGGSTVGFAVGHDRVTVNPDRGPEGAHLPAATSGERIRLGFSVGLLTEVVQTLVGLQVSFDYAASNRPVRVSSASQPHRGSCRRWRHTAHRERVRGRVLVSHARRFTNRKSRTTPWA
ncbi:MAG TPA: hypothetical protein VJ757_10370 [Pseudonocardiaceae bacterium]|nr:hypothetical protein [Pseudonocardiaceae bacterium]